MKVLVVTNMYPNKKLPYYGIFVKEQQQALIKNHPDLDFEVYYIDGFHHKTAYLKSFYEINNILSNKKFDIVHIHYGLSGLFMLSPLASKTPSLLTLHGGDILTEQGKTIQIAITKKVLKHVNAVITLNRTMDQIAQIYNPNTTIIPCSVNTDLFTPPCSRIPLSEKKEWTIIFPSAKKRMVKNYPLFSKTLKLFSAQYGIPCHEVELNNISRQETARLYQQADLMLLTSISEGSPQVVKEAMAANLPIVSTQVGDVEELFRGTKLCACTTERTASALSNLMYKMASKKAEGISGREKLFRMGLDDHSTANKIYNVYNRLLDTTT